MKRPVKISQGMHQLLHPIPAGGILKTPGKKLKLAGDITPPKYVVISVNGIFGTSDGWEYLMAKYINENFSPHFSGAAFYYWCGFMMSGQTDHANKLAEIIREQRKLNPTAKIVIIGHSNAADILKLCLLQNADVWVDDVYLIAAAEYCDCGGNLGGSGWHNCINILQTTHTSGGEALRLGRVNLGISSGDAVLGGPAQWLFPWWWGRTLGKNGPSNCGSNFWVQFSNLPLAVGNLRVGVDNTRGHLTWMTDDSDPTGLNMNTVEAIIAAIAA